MYSSVEYSSAKNGNEYGRGRGARRAAVALAACGMSLGVLAAANVAHAADTGGVRLQVNAPQAVGFAGQPVGFTETISNGTSQDIEPKLEFKVDAAAVLCSAVAIEAKGVDGGWGAIPLACSYSGATTTFTGKLPYTPDVKAGSAATVNLRIGLPMGTPGNGNDNGSTDKLVLTSSVVDASAGTAYDTVTNTIDTKDTPSQQLIGLPGSVAAGGAAEFSGLISNTTPSEYTHITQVMTLPTGASVQRQEGVNNWVTLPLIPPAYEGAARSVALFSSEGITDGITIPAGGTATSRFRIVIPKSTRPGVVTITSYLLVNGNAYGDGTYLDASTENLRVLAAGGSGNSGGTTPSTGPSSTASAPSSTGASAGTVGGTRPSTGQGTTELAATGATSTWPLAGGAAALLAAGGALIAIRRRAHGMR